MMARAMARYEHRARLAEDFAKPIKHEGVLVAREVEAEESENHLFQEAIVELGVFGEVTTPESGVELDACNVAALGLHGITIAPGLDVTQPCLEDEPETGVQRPVVDQIFEEAP